MLIKLHAYKKQHVYTSNSFVALPRLPATTVNCAHELINGESEKKWKLAKFSKIYKQGVLNKVGEGDKKTRSN